MRFVQRGSTGLLPAGVFKKTETTKSRLWGSNAGSVTEGEPEELTYHDGMEQ